MGVLEALLGIPTAPYFEHAVRAFLRKSLEADGIPCTLDKHGNMSAHYRRGKARPIAFTAHMDHPGFELLSVQGETGQARWNGQMPVFDLRGTKLALWSPGEAPARRGTAEVLKGDGRSPGPGTEQIFLRVPASARAGDFGHADLPGFELRGELIASKALDDLAGCAAIVSCLLHLARHRLPGDVQAVFTRAEETGFKGALAACRSRLISRKRPVVVLECSKVIAGVEQGAGPVIRVGDRLSVFDAELVAAALARARELEKELGIRRQRKLLDGGACEASAFCAEGYRSFCLALPLGNYHNTGAEGVSCENIDRRDFLGLVELLSACSVRGLDPSAERRRSRAAMRARLTREDLSRLSSSR
jgi:endoglucanase